MSFAKRFIGVENLPSRLSEYDVREAFALSQDDVAAICDRFRHDRRVAAAIQMLFLRASGRPLDRFATVPKTLLRSVCDALETPAVSIASLRSLYARRQTLYEHQAWAKSYVGLQELDEARVEQICQVLAVAALEAAHPDDLCETARLWLYERRVVIPGSRRVAGWARGAFDSIEAAMAATIEATIGKPALRKAIDWAYSTQPRATGSRLEWLKTAPGHHSPGTMSETLEKIRALKSIGVHDWALNAIALAKQQAYAARVQMRRPSMTARIERRRQIRAGRANLNTAQSGTAAPMGEDRARDDRSRADEQKTAPEPLTGVQGQGGDRGLGRWQDDRRDRAEARRAPEPGDGVAPVADGARRWRIRRHGSARGGAGGPEGAARQDRAVGTGE